MFEKQMILKIIFFDQFKVNKLQAYIKNAPDDGNFLKEGKMLK